VTSLRFVQVDAFTDRPFAGNPAAVMLLDDWLDDATLQAIAAENNLAETAFVVGASGVRGEVELRWFTPLAEVDLCGHATLASGHVLLRDEPGRESVRFATRRAGMLTVRRSDGGYALDLPAWSATRKALAADLVAMVGGEPVESLWHERGYAVLVYADERAIRALRPDFPALAGAGNLLIIATAPGDERDVVSRAFAPAKGVDEDPVTGSAHAVIAAYWAGRLGRDRFTAHQASARGGNLVCTFAGDRVVLEGNCATVIEGTFQL
jgi:PhzF family phenazine biosynthesis protein